MSRILRCSICNKVNQKFIETNIGDLLVGHEGEQQFHPDPKDETQVICIECEISINKIRKDYAVMDALDDKEENSSLVYLEDDDPPFVSIEAIEYEHDIEG